MEKLLEILNDIRPDIEFETESKLIDSGILDSFDIVSIISELNDAFDIHIKVKDLSPENFNSVDKMMNLITTLQAQA